jgi:hypothetical protein
MNQGRSLCHLARNGEILGQWEDKGVTEPDRKGHYLKALDENYRVSGRIFNL